jgi:hypothetical protein
VKPFHTSNGGKAAKIFNNILTHLKKGTEAKDTRKKQHTFKKIK